MLAKFAILVFLVMVCLTSAQGESTFTIHDFCPNLHCVRDGDVSHRSAGQFDGAVHLPGPHEEDGGDVPEGGSGYRTPAYRNHPHHVPAAPLSIDKWLSSSKNIFVTMLSRFLNAE